MKVTIIGGGSYQWGPTLVTDLLTTPSIAGRDLHLVLEDVDPRPLPQIEKYARLAADQIGVPLTVITTTDQREALAGADFVVVTISTGGFRSMRADLDVPARHGIRQSVGDTVGPGGVSRSLRNVPVLAGIARDLHELSPDAWLLNITNPMTCLTRAAQQVHPKTVGLCHEIFHFRMEAALVLGIRVEDVQPVIGGVNHLPIITALDIQGRDGFDVLREVAEQGRTSDDTNDVEFEFQSKTHFARAHQLKLGLLQRFGALPGAGDRHVAEFFPHFLTEASGWGEAWGVHLTTIEEREADQAEFVRNVELTLAGERNVPGWQSGEMVAPVIDSLITGERRELPLNLPNRGQLAGFPEGPVVETMCLVDGDGMRGREEVALPHPFDEWVRRHVATQELTVEGALSGDRRLALEAFSLDPLAGRNDLRDTEVMMDELLAATAEWLPRFAGKP